MKTVSQGFSLVEVVVAVGVFVAGVVAAVALLSQTTSSASERLERAAAQRVSASMTALLPTFDWDQVVSRAEGGEAWYANREGTLLDAVDPLSAGERFYRLALERDVERFPVGAEQTAAQADLWLITTWPVQDAAGVLLSGESQTIERARVILRR